MGGEPVPKVREFISMMEEATGFSCQPQVKSLSDAPYASSYVFSTFKAENDFIECGVPATIEEMNEIAFEIDDYLFPEDVDMLKALRVSITTGHPLLFREGDEPVQIRNVFSGRRLIFYPRGNPNLLDNSLTHLVGFTAIEVSRNLGEDLESVEGLIHFENGIWSAIYSLPVPEAKPVKWIWDLRGASLIELSR